VDLYLVRHGRPLVDASRPAQEWHLDPVYDDDVRALRGRLPISARWFSSSEPKAFLTARLLTAEPIEVVADLREHERHSAGWIEDFEAVVARAFAEPDLPAYDGWEPLARTRRRVVRAVAEIVDRAGESDLVLVGHATAWTCLVSALTGLPPDLVAWANLAMPDVIQCGDPRGRGDMLGT
jgi:broad specificity phosphatase PhoE